MWYEVEPLALYRMHSNSSTGRRARTGENIQDLRRAVGIMKEYLPTECADKLTQTALKNYAFSALNTANEFFSVGDRYAARNQLREALLCHSSPSVVSSSLKLGIKIFFLKVLLKLGWAQPVNS
jgi:hypothetical protein